MPKYCPFCHSEFSVQLKNCPKDKHALLNEKPEDIKIIFVDIFAVSNEVEAQNIVLFLKEQGLEAKEARFGISQLPVVSDTDYVICVKKEQTRDAIKLIETAQKDGAISKYGRFVNFR